MGDHDGTKGEASHPSAITDSRPIRLFSPTPGCPQIILFTTAIIMLALAQTDPPKVWADTDHVPRQHAHGNGLNYLVVQGPAKQRMWMGDQGQSTWLLALGVVNGQFQWADRAIHGESLGLRVQTRPRCGAGPPAPGR